MYEILKPKRNYDNKKIEIICAQFTKPATVFLFQYGDDTNLAIDTEPDVNWGDDITQNRTIIGTFKPRDLYKNVLPYARML